MTRLRDQSGGNAVPEHYYSEALRAVSVGCNLLNLGCGNRFTFERMAHVRGASRIVSIDRLGLEEGSIPPFVRFIEADIEQPLLESIDLQPESFDLVTFFEVIEHIDETDQLIRTCYDYLSPSGLLIFSFPNLASIYGRLELLCGLQPHILEVSNENGTLGGGLPGRMNNRTGDSIHHIRGITTRAMKALVGLHGFEMVSAHGLSMGPIPWPSRIIGLAPQNVFVCQKARP